MLKYTKLVKEMVKGGIPRERAIHYVVRSFGLSQDARTELTWRVDHAG